METYLCSLSCERSEWINEGMVGYYKDGTVYDFLKGITEGIENSPEIIGKKILEAIEELGSKYTKS